ncbi:sensor histidine kinase [Ruminiclostridium herbifermentans]|nr:sensor histidine kinase [Ruminiclostridium herbifermentans]
MILTIYLKYARWNYFDFFYLFPNIIENSFYFIFIIGMIYIAGYQTHQSQILSNTMNELKMKSNELEKVNNKLQETMKSLEEMTVLRERNRIAREIHDTIGHTLTTVSIEIEAGKRLAEKDLNLALEKFELAQEQVRKGLNDIRSSVRMLKDGNGVLPFIPSIQALINETELHAGVSVKFSFSQLPFLNPEQEKVLYRVVQEGLTNGIRHGKCTEFVLQLEFKNNRIILLIVDNGKGCDDIAFGFGLNAMKERVEELRGNLSFKSSLGNGCSLKVDIPIEEECINGYY